MRRYYGEAARILKPDGLLIISEYHPFTAYGGIRLITSKCVSWTTQIHGRPGCIYRGRGELEQFTFRWTVADNIGAILASGCELVSIEEFGDTCEEWEEHR